MAKAAKKNLAVGVAEAEIVWRGSADLRPLLVPLAELHADPANVNVHDERSLGAIAGAYARFGQQKAVVIDEHGVVRAGNGQLVAAGRLGWTHLAATVSDLSGVELMAYSLADNQVPKLARWDVRAVAAQLKALQAEGAAIADLGWSDYELGPMLAADWSAKGDGTPSTAVRPLILGAGEQATVDEAVQALGELMDDATLGVGRCLELICRGYLAAMGR